MIHIVFSLFVIIHLLHRIIQFVFADDKVHYFVLHALFNLWVILHTLQDMFDVFTLSELSESNSGYITTLGIIVFHTHHTLVSWKTLSFSDKVHHLGSAIGVGTIALIFKPHFLASSNFFTCGFPGFIDYTLLCFEKYNFIHKLTEKRINCFLNLVIRLPGQCCSSILFLNYVFRHNTIEYQIIAVLLSILHMYNAVYYADLVVRNYEKSSSR